MAHKNQIEFINQNKDLIKEPIMLVGAKIYDYDQFDLFQELQKMGFTDILGTDIAEGKGVDQVLDITDTNAEFIKINHKRFATIICMEVLTNVVNPFKAAENVTELMRDGGIVILSEVFVRKISKMPIDYWRFTYDGLKSIFPRVRFIDERNRFSITRQKNAQLLKFTGRFEEIMSDVRHLDETRFGFLIRRIHRRFFSNGIFKVSRLMPEQTVYAIGTLNKAE